MKLRSIDHVRLEPFCDDGALPAGENDIPEVTVEAVTEVHEPAPAAPDRPVQSLRLAGAVMPQGITRTVQMADVAEVERMCAAQVFVPFRVLRTFSYSVSLLFHPDELTYYAVLYQETTLWQALKATELDAAEESFRHFEEQVIRLADAELRLTQLVAQNRRMTSMVEATEAQAERMRADLEHHAAQTQLVNARQQQLRKEVAQLEQQRLSSQAVLNKAVRTIHQLRATSNERIPRLASRQAAARPGHAGTDSGTREKDY